MDQRERGTQGTGKESKSWGFYSGNGCYEERERGGEGGRGERFIILTAQEAEAGAL